MVTKSDPKPPHCNGFIETAFLKIMISNHPPTFSTKMVWHSTHLISRNAVNAVLESFPLIQWLPMVCFHTEFLQMLTVLIWLLRIMEAKCNDSCCKKIPYYTVMQFIPSMNLLACVVNFIGFYGIMQQQTSLTGLPVLNDMKSIIN